MFAFLPASGNRNNGNGLLYNQGTNGNYWSVSIISTNAYNLNFNSGNVNPANSNNRANGFALRCIKNLHSVCACSGRFLMNEKETDKMENMETCDILKPDLFRAYYDARKHKRNTVNQLKFEVNFERELFSLYEEISSRNYKMRPSICFVVDVPVKREVFAADFRDRVVHHLVCRYIDPILERVFIEDSYSCRKGKGTLYGIRRIEQFIRECSENYTRDCYILKLDIRGYFMNIDKYILEKQLLELLSNENIENAYHDTLQPDWDLVRYLIKEIIFQDVKEDCIIKGASSDWNGLPQSKSLFHSLPGRGLPIGNLTSQYFSNIYMHAFDDYITSASGIKYYGRYVDDFIIIHRDKDFLKKLIPQIKDFLEVNLHLELHPKKIYLQHYTKGVQFLGAVIKPNRLYVAKRTVSHFKKAIHGFNCRMASQEFPDKENLYEMRSTVNSYLGVMQHFKSYNVKKKILFGKPNVLFRYGYFTSHLNKYKLYKKTKQGMADAIESESLSSMLGGKSGIKHKIISQLN